MAKGRAALHVEFVQCVDQLTLNGARALPLR
jgi:hypothetical protein